MQLMSQEALFSRSLFWFLWHETSLCLFSNFYGSSLVPCATCTLQGGERHCEINNLVQEHTITLPCPQCFSTRTSRSQCAKVTTFPTGVMQFTLKLFSYFSLQILVSVTHCLCPHLTVKAQGNSLRPSAALQLMLLQRSWDTNRMGLRWTFGACKYH